LILHEKLTLRLEKILKETAEQRTHQLLSISEKEMSQINKQAHQIIKLKKKRAAQTTQNKEEFQRYSNLNNTILF
jgi:hypothetical protein